LITRRDEAPVRWTVAECLRWTEGYFQRLGLAEPRLDAEVLLAEALGCSRLDLYTGYERLVEPAERARFRALIERRAKHEPVAYIVGRRDFYSLAFEVSPAVLIPRPETEHLVEEALAELKGLAAAGRESPFRVLDLGTGSGCIAVAIARHAPQAVVGAVDASAPALEVARRNAAKHEVAGRIEFHRGDLFAALPAGTPPYDVLVSNPPYIAPADHAALMEDVRLHEPREALCDTRGPDPDGLGFYREIAARARDFVRRGGLVAVEVGGPPGPGRGGQAGAVVELLGAAGLERHRIAKDLAGIERVVVFRV
jgi:release factor glutamine methyltransferase